MFDDFNVGGKDKYYLLLLIIFSGILVAHYINFNVKVGVSCSDVYVYLLNALYYTGTNRGATGFIYLSPLICFLTSLLFRVGLVDKLAIFIVTGAFAILGNIGIYLLFRQFYDEKLSICGAIIYSTTTLSLTWLANGTLDVPAVGMTIWFVLFGVIAINKNPKFYTYAIPIFAIGFFTRYTLILTLPALLLYYVYEKGFKIEKDDWKYIKRGILIAVTITAVILATVLIMGHGQFGAASQMAGGISGKQGSSRDPAYNTELGYYLFNLPNFISNSHTVFEGNPVLENPTALSWITFAILIIGAILWLRDSELKLEKRHAIPLIIFLIACVTYTRISSVLTTLIVLLGLYILGKDSENRTGYLMIAWILANFIFFSYFSIKVNRYILPIFPALIYFLLKSVSMIQNRIKINKAIIPAILIVLFMIQGFAFTMAFEPTDKYNATEDISNYLKGIEPDYQDIDIGVYNIRPFRWWIGDNVIGIPNSYVDKIENSNLTYYISNTKMDNLENYSEIKNIDTVYLYKKTGQ
ncbi:glycosyltransferase family 39 protein [uncultured Methanobrevibacter sp.]|uniref:glycosyltransferase family 39 protein n=1 Tax=uncultured Methanobrevibacter sp. TaxID=253161 RepID=UPI002612FCD8|nr:glycosyltransferase family 39 protein [uncultured Methanobrevibacter sp.]